MVAAAPALDAAEAVEHGAYLTDGKRLYRVCDATEGQVRLENCWTLRLDWQPVRMVLAEMRLVRKSRS